MQLKTSSTISFFHETFKSKYNFEEYLDLNKPTIFFGLYSNSDRQSIIAHRGIKIVWFAGADATMFTDPSFLEGAIVIAESPWIKKDLDKFGVKYEQVSLFMDDIYNWHSEPLGDSLYWYGAHNSKYGKKYLADVQRALPDLNIITNDQKTVPRDQMSEVYKQCFACVRPVEHDGMSQTVAEAALMGRMSIWNMDTPFSLSFQGVEGIIERIKELRLGYNPKLVSKRARGYFCAQEAKWANLVLKLCGTDELGATGIFEESVDRCGSIFRLVRRKDIDKIGGLGTEQMERPWFSSQMIRLGKKQLITSKNSGFIASEFKGINNKGYATGFKEFRTYDTRYS